MSWLGLRHKGVEILYPDEWNRVVDGLDILKQYTEQTLSIEALKSLETDIVPAEDNTYNLGGEDKQWRNLYAHYGYVTDNLYVQGKPVLKDGDPVTVMYFEGPAKQEIDQIYLNTLPPSTIQTLIKNVGTRPVPLADVEQIVRRLHIKVPRTNVYLVYIGNEERQDYILEPGDLDVFELVDPSKIYVRSLGSATLFLSLETLESQ